MPNDIRPTRLGIEIGGTKLQFGVARHPGQPLLRLVRIEINADDGAQAILRQIADVAPAMISKHRVRSIGIGFGGPVDVASGRTVKSHQVEGWDDFPLADWCRQTLGIRATIGNDCDVAALAEARYGAGQGERVVFYVTVGTGVGGGLVVDGKTYYGAGISASEIGHLRPGPAASGVGDTVESIASGAGIENAIRRRIDAATGSDLQYACDIHDTDDITSRCSGDVNRLTAKIIADAAQAGNQTAADTLDRAVRTLGWAIAQMVSLLSPGAIVVGGGVSLICDRLFLTPLAEATDQFVFPPLRGSYRIARAALGEDVVVQGAITLAGQPA